MSSQPEERSRVAGLGDEISHGFVADLYRRFVTTVGELHPSVRVRSSRVEARFFYNDELLCRVVLYRELFHVQIGDAASWETRVRNEAGFLDAVDRTVQRFLQIHAIPPGQP